MKTLALASLLFCLAACTPPDPGLTDPLGYPEAIGKGASVTVQFRRDHLGTAASLPVPPDTRSMNGAATAVSGKLHTISRAWIVVDSGKERHWIARASVLMITSKSGG